MNDVPDPGTDSGVAPDAAPDPEVDPETVERQRHGRRFGRAAADYEQGRPDYPPELFTRLAAEVPLPDGGTALDLGAGTGKLTRRLTGRFDRVIAVEPSEGMRSLLAEVVPQAEPMAGTAEQVPLPDDSVDAVVVADAFHWFDVPRALAEITRVLRPGGLLMLSWNEALGGTEPALPPAARDVIRAAFDEGGEPGGPRLQRLDWRSAFTVTDFEALQRTQLDHELALARDQLVSYVLSISSIAGLPDARRAALRRQLRELLPAGTYRRALRLTVHWTRLGAPGSWCGRCGSALTGGPHPECDATRDLEPPRYCRHCGRRMKVQVLPSGWTARCVEHGESTG